MSREASYCGCREEEADEGQTVLLCRQCAKSFNLMLVGLDDRWRRACTLADLNRMIEDGMVDARTGRADL